MQAAKDALAINSVSYHDIAFCDLALYADLGLAIKFKPPCPISGCITYILITESATYWSLVRCCRHLDFRRMPSCAKVVVKRPGLTSHRHPFGNLI